MKEPLLLGGMAGLQLLGALFIQLYLVRSIGVGADTDILVASQAVPMVAGAILLAALQSAWLPRLSRSVDTPAEFHLDMIAAQGQALLLCIFTYATIAVTAYWWMPVVFSTFSAAQLIQARCFTVIFLVGATFSCLSNVLTFALRAQRKYLLPEVIGVAVTFVALLLAVLSVPIYGIWAGVFIIVVRTLFTYLALSFVCHLPTVNWRLALNTRDAWVRMFPVLSASFFYKSSPLVDRYFASQSTIGGLTLFNLAMSVMGSFAIVIERALCTSKIPGMSRRVVAGDFQAARAVYRRGVLQVSALSTVAIVFLLLAQQPIQWVASALLRLDLGTAHQLWLFMVVLVGYAFASAAGTLPVALFHAMGNTKLPSLIGAIGVSISIAIKYFGFISYGLWGLLLATSLHYVLTVMVMCFAVERSIHARVA